MRDKWFGDDRDLAKWGTLVHLAEEEAAETIVQIAFYRQSGKPCLFDGKGREEIHEEVWDFFRNCENIERLGSDFDFSVRIFSREFTPSDRSGYLRCCTRFVKKCACPRIVFLDPDTGLQPERANAEHVTRSELRTVWEALDKGDRLVLYQHARRTGSWREDVREEFQNTLGVTETQEFYSPSVARDVTFFSAQAS